MSSFLYLYRPGSVTMGQSDIALPVAVMLEALGIQDGIGVKKNE
ncbi:hypothetical protein [Pusillimonas sp. T2]|nr:hypothetical protein [Pusillimonas sp. T2]